MKNKGIIIFLIILAAVIVAVIVSDYFSKRPDRMEANPFEYNIDEFRDIPEEMIQYRETKNFKIGFEEPKGITINDDKIYLVGDKKLKIIDISGKLLMEFALNNIPSTVEVADGSIYISFEKLVQVFNENGELIREWNLEDDKTLITALAAKDDNLFIADAGNRKIMRFSNEGKKLNEWEGKASEDVLHGFIIPSPYFDIDINEEGDLWVVNPGMHSLENYTEEGNLREHWSNSSMKTEGFSGCCNPTHYTFLQDGSFVTSEKGLVRIKIYKPSGEFSAVVA